MYKKIENITGTCTSQQKSGLSFLGSRAQRTRALPTGKNRIYVDDYQNVILRARSIESRRFTAQTSSFLFVMILRAAPVTSELVVDLVPILSTRMMSRQSISLRTSSQNGTLQQVHISYIYIDSISSHSNFLDLTGRGLDLARVIHVPVLEPPRSLHVSLHMA